MNFTSNSIAKKLFLITSLFLYNFTVFADAVPTHVEIPVKADAPVAKETIIDTVAELSEEKKVVLLDMVQNQIDKLKAIMQSIGQYLQQDNFFKHLKKDDKKALKEILVELQKTLTEMQQEVGITAKTTDLILLAKIVREFTRALAVSLEKKLKIAPQINLENVVTRSATPLSEKDIEALVIHNEKLLPLLDKIAADAPLTWYNHAARKVTSTWKKYKLGPITERIGVYGAMGLWTLYMIPKPILEQYSWMPNAVLKLKDKVGGIPAGTSREVTTTNTGSAQKMNAEEFAAFKEQYLAAHGTAYPHNVAYHKLNIGNVVIQGEPGQLLDGSGAKISNLDTVVEFMRQPGEAEDAYAHRYAETMKMLVQESTTDKRGLFTQAATGFFENLTSAPFNTICTLTGGSYFSIELSKKFADYAYSDFMYLKDETVKKLNDLRDFLEARKTIKQSYDATSTKTFDDILGRESIKARFEPLINAIVHPDRYNRANINIPSGYLLVGPPQTGKTFLLDCISGEIAKRLEMTGQDTKLRVYTVTVDDINKKGVPYWIGLAKRAAPCIIFIDEFDLVGAQRDRNAQLLAECLQYMHKSILNDERAPVYLIAASNRPETIDYALREPGRFGELTYFNYPLHNDRAIYFEEYFKKRSMDTSQLDIDMLIRATEGRSYGVMETTANKILTFAKAENKPVQQYHIVKAVDDAVKQVVKYDQLIPEDVLKVIATRFAAKAVTSLLLQPDKSLCSVTVDQVVQEIKETHAASRYWDKHEQQAMHFGGIFSYNRRDTLGLVSESEKIKQIKINVAGNIGQRVMGMDYVTHELDIKTALNDAQDIIFRGQEPNSFSRYEREKKLAQSYKLVEECEKETLVLLTKHKDVLEKVIAMLMKSHSVSAEAIQEACPITPVVEDAQGLIGKVLKYQPPVNVMGDDKHSTTIWM